jgi:hypothetical protein
LLVKMGDVGIRKSVQDSRSVAPRHAVTNVAWTLSIPSDTDRRASKGILVLA